MTRKRVAVAALLVELTIVALSGAAFLRSSEEVYWWLWSVAPIPKGVDRPQRPTP